MSELSRDPANRSSDALFTYFHSIILIIIAYVRLLSQQLGQRLTAIELALEKRVDDTDSVVALLDSKVKAQDAKLATAVRTALAASAPTPSGASASGSSSSSTTTQRTTTRGQSAPSTAATQGSSGRLLKCSKCHARGHHADDCRSSNPAAVRRRVSQNKKLRGGQRFDATALTPSNLSLLPSLPSAAPTYYAPPTTYVPGPAPTVVAEAAELRRRIAQSNRDRRRNRARTSTPTSSSK
jgi:hypothetical protein